MKNKDLRLMLYISYGFIALPLVMIVISILENNIYSAMGWILALVYIHFYIRMIDLVDKQEKLNNFLQKLCEDQQKFINDVRDVIRDAKRKSRKKRTEKMR